MLDSSDVPNLKSNEIEMILEVKVNDDSKPYTCAHRLDSVYCESFDGFSRGILLIIKETNTRA